MEPQLQTASHCQNRRDRKSPPLLVSSELTLDAQLSLRYLSNNKISVLELGALDHLSSTLQILRLSRNRISQIPVRAFQLPRLTQL